MDDQIRPRKFTATFRADDHKKVEFDVTDEIVSFGGVIPDADPRGSDVLQFAKNAPDSVRNYQGHFFIEVTEA